MERTEKDVRDYVKCCACEGTLKDSEHINAITLDKEATWEFPIWNNILVLDKYPENRALGYICDKCVAEGKMDRVKFAVEYQEGYTNIKYHKVEGLKDLPEITQKDVEEAERRIHHGHLTYEMYIEE
jgi:hypothetical protein